VSYGELSKMKPRTHGFWFAGMLLWGSVAGAGFFGLSFYESTPGPRGDAPRRWPGDCSVQADAGRFNLVMALHPNCPCSRSSVRELAAIQARHSESVAVHVLLYSPEADQASWHDADLERTLSEIPGVRIVRDPGALIAVAFGAKTSGHVILYGADGNLAFSGGITRGRGVAGNSPGREIIVRQLLGDRPAVMRTEVFGCPLVDSSGL